MRKQHTPNLCALAVNQYFRAALKIFQGVFTLFKLSNN